MPQEHTPSPHPGRMKRHLAAVLALAGTLTLSMAPASGGTTTPPEPTQFTDIAYTEPEPADTQGNLLDIHLPEGEHQGPLPVLIWTDGSAWMADNGKEGAAAIAEEFTPRGFAVVGVSVRSSSQVQFPGQLHDIRAAVRWLRVNAEDYGLDPDRIAIMGNSSGGWVASIAATTSHIPQLEGEAETEGVSSAVQASVPIFPPIDFLELDAQIEEQFATYDDLPFEPMPHDVADSPESLLVGCPIQECPEETALANPTTYLTEDMPPIRLFHGTHDEYLPPGTSQAFFEALMDVGADVTFTLVDGAGHSVEDIIDAESFTVFTPGSGGIVSSQEPAPTWDTIEDFLWSTLGDPQEDEPEPTPTPAPTPTGEPTETPETSSPAPSESAPDETSGEEETAGTQTAAPEPSATETVGSSSGTDPASEASSSAEPDTEAASEDLADTGARAIPLIAGSLLLILLGATAVLWRRKRSV